MKVKRNGLGNSLLRVGAFILPMLVTPGLHAHDHGETAAGSPGRSEEVARTINVDMSDAMRFTPSSLQVRQGETIRFVVRNSGAVRHEMVLGTTREIKMHHAAMKKAPDMVHDDPNVAVVEPGKTSEIIWRFSRSGTVAFACLQAGHFEAGMKGSIRVSPGKGKSPASEHAGHH